MPSIDFLFKKIAFRNTLIEPKNKKNGPTFTERTV